VGAKAGGTRGGLWSATSGGGRRRPKGRLGEIGGQSGKFGRLEFPNFGRKFANFED